MQANDTDSRAPLAGYPGAYGQETGHGPAPTEIDSYDPRQRRRHAGRTVALLVASLAIPGAIAAVVALGSGGGADGGEGGDAPEESYAAALEGDGYSYAIPSGWRDATDWARDVAPDSAESAVAVTQPDDGFGTNVLVTAWDASGLEQAREEWLSADSGDLQTLDAMSIDGERAVGVRWEGRNDKGRRVVQIGYLALLDDRAYSIVLSARVESEADYLPTFDHLLDTWSWEDDAATTV